MITNKIYSLIMIKTSMMLTLMFFMFSKFNLKLILEWNMIKFLSLNFNMNFTFDSYSLIFSSSILIISSSIMLYSYYYMNHNKKKNMFFKLIMMFIMFMLIVIHSSNMISMIMGWEGLGMISFILIMFYQNKKSLMMSISTMMNNRIGDIMMILSIIMMMNFNSWSFMNHKFNMMIIFMILISAFSKSAQIPFSSWLTDAMAAPTPISALVHSSTLVTAGIFLLIRFKYSIFMMKEMKNIIFIMSLMTLFMASMNSIIEWDIKKIIALSTLSQMSIMFISISMNFYNLAFFHLITHAMFKSLIFLCASSYINIYNNQNIKFMGNYNYNMNFNNISFNIANLSLCGMPYLSGFYSKDLIIEMMMINKFNILMLIIFMKCMLITMFYSFKMMIFINIKKDKKQMIMFKENMYQKISKSMILIFTIMNGNWMNWILIPNNQIFNLPLKMKLLPIIMMIINFILIYKLMIKKNMNNYMKNKKIIMMINYMMFMKNFSINLKNKNYKINILNFKNSEKGMMEFFINKNLKNFSNLSIFNKKILNMKLMMMIMNIIMIMILINI
uniref:NADH-ubiquinone oxidoreductase chain 5 n=1 Tax=Aleurodicus dugesii TaxID=30099 RepID=Q6JCU0_ALEDU|nr:NADH dehydrogenase subunit 5 [Aleurodicus dugesii]AAS77749.1 NADH dehydrogenase subunit 5 [Aleurodicus dugesii]